MGRRAPAQPVAQTARPRRPRPAAGTPRRALAGAVAVAVAGLGITVARAQDATQDAGITRQAYFTHPATEAIPPLLTNGFPPATVCLVAGLVGVPQLCGELVRDLLDPLGLSDGLPILSTPDSQIVQPVLPGTTPVGMLLGQERYVSLLQFPLPVLPEGERFASFDLVLHQDGLNLALESPAFRELVFDVIAQLDERDPELFLATLARVVSGELPLLTQNVTGIEACPVLEEWNAGDAQDAALDGTRLPDSDCIRGTTGTFDPETGTWTFDLTFAVQAWEAGDLPNQGIILRPVGAPNVAYGDPDLSTNFIVSLADGEAQPGKRPAIRFTTIVDAPPTTPTTADTVPAPTAGPLPPSGGGAVTRPPTTAPPTTTAPVGGPLSVQWAELAATTSAPRTSGWTLLWLPVAAAGAWAFGSALLARPPLTRRRPGALTQLMETRDEPA